MPDAAPDDEEAVSGTTFYLDDRDGEGSEGSAEHAGKRDASEHGRRGFHGAEHTRMPRFLLWGCALLLTLGLVLGLAFEGASFLKEHYWGLLLWAGIVFLVYRFKFRQRPYFQIAEAGLAFRTTPYRAERRVAWDDLESVELEPGSVVLRRTADGPVHLHFSRLSAERTQALTEALAEAARQHGARVA